jgi:hypothetical protein
MQPLDLTVQVEQPTITITPEPINLTVFTGGFAQAAGNNGTVQYNNGGVLAGLDSVFWTGTQLNLGNTNNITISGGSANYALITDGAGNLSWQDIENANIANTANYANFAGNVTIASQPNITSLGTLISLSVNGTANLRSVSNVKITGGTNGQYLQTDGTGNLAWVSGGGTGNGVVGGSNTQVQFNDAGNFGGSTAFTFNKSSNVLNVVGNVTASNVVSTPIANLPYGSEAVTITTTAPNTYNLDLLSSSVVLCTANATANTILNIRGNSSVTANSLVSVGQSITNTILIKTGTTAYTVTTLQIDGGNQTINWVSGAVPAGASNSLVSYTFTAIKTASTPTYTVLGSATRYA